LAERIEPRTLKGFRDYAPDLMLPREHLLEQVRRVYRSYGFLPIDTPALEYAEILLGKGGEESDRLIYRFHDHGGRDVALRFDLTVPFARFAAQYIGQFGVPFKRYQTGPVWRGENTAQGRYREFWQCDFDTIGTASNSADIEVALVIHDLLEALGFSAFRIHINNRLVLNGLLETLGLLGQAAPLLRALDKLSSAGLDAVRTEMMDKAGVTGQQADKIMQLAHTRGSNQAILDRLEADFGTNETAKDGIQRLRELIAVVGGLDLRAERFVLDLSIARGLDYYTGSVFETFLTDLPGIGSVCSGGRYDNLAGLYTKQELPGVGASLGLDRLLAAMERLKILPPLDSAAPVLVAYFDSAHLVDYQRMARALRAAGIGAEVFTDCRKIGQQLRYAEKRHFRLALIAGPDEFLAGTWKVKDLARREEVTVADDTVVSVVQQALGLAGGQGVGLGP
jgi:histidyl-tRNA synthetase